MPQQFTLDELDSPARTPARPAATARPATAFTLSELDSLAKPPVAPKPVVTPYTAKAQANKTALAPDEEKAFQVWYKGWAGKAGLDQDPDNPAHKYDYRGAYKSGASPEINKADGLYHWPSPFKADDHPNRVVDGIDTKTGKPVKPQSMWDKRTKSAHLPKKPGPGVDSAYESIKLGPFSAGEIIGGIADVISPETGVAFAPARWAQREVATLAEERQAKSTAPGQPGRAEGLFGVSAYQRQQTVNELKRSTQKLTADIALDPTNLLPLGAAFKGARTAFRVTADALFIAMAEAGTVQSLYEYQKTKDPDLLASAAMQQGFALIGMAGIGKIRQQRIAESDASKRTVTQIAEDHKALSKAEPQATPAVKEAVPLEAGTHGANRKRFTLDELDELAALEKAEETPASKTVTPQPTPEELAAADPVMVTKESALRPEEVLPDEPPAAAATSVAESTAKMELDQHEVRGTAIKQKDLPKEEFRQALTDGAEAATPEARADYLAKLKASAERQRDESALPHIERAEKSLAEGDAADFAAQAEIARAKLSSATQRADARKMVAEMVTPEELAAFDQRIAEDTANKPPHFLEAPERQPEAVKKAEAPPERKGTPLAQMIQDHAEVEMQRWAEANEHITQEPQSLMEFLWSKGGVRDEFGDLESREIDKGRKKFQKNFIQEKDGLPLDTAREYAVESGYLPEGATLSDLLDAIDDEHSRGRIRTSNQVEEGTGKRGTALEGFGLKTVKGKAVEPTPAELSAAIRSGKGKLFQEIRKAFEERAVDERSTEMQDFLDREEAAKLGDEVSAADADSFDFGVGFDTAEPAAGGRPSLPAQTTQAKGELVAKSQILRDLSNRLGVPLRVGRFPQRAWGIFKVRPEVARVKVANDVATASHEFGHAINKIMYGTRAGNGVNLNWRPFTPFQHELRAIATKPRAGQSPLPEGFAEFVRMYLTNPAEAATKAPNFSAFFDSELAGFPELRETLRTAQKDIGRWINQPAVAKVLSAISVKDPPMARNRWNEFYTNVVDKLEPVRKAVEAMGGAPTDKNAYEAARLFAGWTGKADHFLQRGTFDPATNAVTGPGLKRILKTVDGDLDNFRALLVAKRAVEKSKQGIETGIELADAQETIRQLSNPVRERAAQGMYAYNNSLLDYLEARGILSSEQKTTMQALNRDYVPFYRAFETDAAGAPKRAGTEFGSVGTAVHRMYGSGRDIIDPLESTVKNTYALINLAERNEVTRILVDQAKSVNASGKFIERVPQKMEATKFELSQIKKDLEAAGVETGDIDLETMATVFKPGHEAGGKDNILSVVRDGKREYYQVEPELYRALQGLDDAGSHLLIRALSVPAQMLRVGATALSPEFALRNPIRDAFTAAMQSEYGFKPGIDTARGVFHAIKRDDLYWEWKRSGGEHAAMASLDRTELQKNLSDLMASPVKYAVRHPFEALKMLSAFGEAGTRVGEYSLAKKKGATPQEAALASRNVSIDFARHGASTRAVNSIVAFWNAGVQGMDQFARLHIQHPMRSTVRGLAGLTVPSLILYSVNKDNEKYQDLPRWRRDFFWNIPTDGTALSEYTPFIAIPKPFDWGSVYSTFPERIAEWVDTEDPAAFDDFAKNFAEAALPGVVPTAIIPPLEAWGNKSMFTGRPIVPMHLQRLEPEFQYEYYTSEFAKTAARTLAGVSAKSGVDVRVSPMQIDNAVFGYSGGFGRLMADLSDPTIRALAGSPEPPAQQASDMPVLRGFAVRYPGGTTEPMQKFYNRLNVLERKRSTLSADRAGRLTGAAPVSPQEAREYAILNAANTWIQGQRRTQRQIIASGVSRQEKRNRIDAIDIAIAARAKKAVQDTAVGR